MVHGSGAATREPAPSSAAAVELAATANASKPIVAYAPSRAELSRALAATQRRLGAALRQIDALLIEGSQLKRTVTSLEESAIKARRFAYHDELTGLPNRRLLRDHFNQAVARGARRGTQVAVLFLDLDGFKDINDALGHSVGDVLLQHVATRLIQCFAPPIRCAVSAETNS